MVYTCRAGAGAGADAETISSGCCWLVGPSELGRAAGYRDVPVAPALGQVLGWPRALCLPQLLALYASYAKLPARFLQTASFAAWTPHFLGITASLMNPTGYGVRNGPRQAASDIAGCIYSSGPRALSRRSNRSATNSSLASTVRLLFIN